MAQGVVLRDNFGLSTKGQSESSIAGRRAALEMLNLCLFAQGKASFGRTAEVSLCDPGFYAQFCDYAVNHAVSSTAKTDSALMCGTILGYLSHVKEAAKEKTEGEEPGKTFWKDIGWYTTLRAQTELSVKQRCINTAQPISKK